MHTESNPPEGGEDLTSAGPAPIEAPIVEEALPETAAPVEERVIATRGVPAEVPRDPYRLGRRVWPD